MLKRARLLCLLVLCVSRAVLSVELGAWSVRFVGWANWVDCRCFLSFVFLGVARRLELSPCNTSSASHAWPRVHVHKYRKAVSVGRGVLHGESSKRLATPRKTKDKKQLQSTQSAQPTYLTDQAPSTTLMWCVTGRKQQTSGITTVDTK